MTRNFLEEFSAKQPQRDAPTKYLELDHDWINVTTAGDDGTYVVCSQCGERRKVKCKPDDNEQPVFDLLALKAAKRNWAGPR